uniref:RRM domain-containing protein n=1 Tax=Strongyloides stercoralis TaxID=6248 RepID=A0AAF5D7N6_STRER
MTTELAHNILEEVFEDKPKQKDKLIDTDRKSRDSHRKRDRSRSRSRSDSPDDDKDRKHRRDKEKSKRYRSRSRSKDRKHKSSRNRSRSRDRRRRSRSRSTSKDYDRNYRRRDRDDYGKDRRRDQVKRNKRSPPVRERRDVMPYKPRPPPPDVNPDLTPEEREERTIFILQLSKSTRPRDLEEFFSAVGPVRDVRIIQDAKTMRSKGIAYVEFWKRETVALALGLNQERLHGCPLVIQRSLAEKNRVNSGTVASSIGFGTAETGKGPVTLHVSNLHSALKSSQLQQVFGSYGKIQKIELFPSADPNIGQVGLVTFAEAEHARKALADLHNFLIVERHIKVVVFDPKTMEKPVAHTGPTNTITNSSTIEGQCTGQAPTTTAQAVSSVRHEAYQCFLLVNMFDASKEEGDDWDKEIRLDVIDAMYGYGGAVHVHVEKNSQNGEVYVKAINPEVATKAVNALHGRLFEGRTVQASYTLLDAYHELFPESIYATEILKAD